MPCAAIIVASGSSRRMGFDKLAAELDGTSVLRRSVDAFMAAEGIDHVIVVCPPDRFESLLAGDFPKPIRRVDGGSERQLSVEAGLNDLDEADHWVAVHDGARPLVDPEEINRCIEAAKEHEAATLARPVTETIKKADQQEFATHSVDRSSLWFTETPQIFKTSLLRRAYAHVAESGLCVTDEVSAVESLGVSTKLISSSGPNLKITHPSDILLAQALLR